MGFGVFYSVSAAALTAVLGGPYCAHHLSHEVARLRRILGNRSCMKEFKSHSRCRSRNCEWKSPAHVFPLPPYSENGHLVCKSASLSTKACSNLLEGVNLTVAVVNAMLCMEGRWIGMRIWFYLLLTDECIIAYEMHWRPWC